MERLVIVGSQWGDEGKGKVTDYLAQRADVVVRSQGGNNAGHTIVFQGQKFALRSIPSGIFNPKTKNVMASGMVIHPKQMLEELQMLKERGITEIQLYISDRAHVVFPYHEVLDGAYEALKENGKIGTTKRGIGPCYADKANRIGIRIGQLIQPNVFKEALKSTLAIKNMELRMLGLPPFDYDSLLKEYSEYAERIRPYVCDTSVLLNEEIEKHSKILFEGAQGVMLCLDHGTYPYVTSSSPTGSSVSLNVGIAPRYITDVLGICKAYTTRVGEGPFPTEMSEDLAEQIRERGHEYGTVTKRPRRVGYLDAVALNHAKRVSGINHLALMLLDVLTEVPVLKICYAYRLDGKILTNVPSTVEELMRAEPLYVELPGWKEDISRVSTFEELPKNCQAYLKKIEELTSLPISLFSVGPDRMQTIEREPLLK